MRTQDGGPAFPSSHDYGWSEKLKRYEAVGDKGMSIRDWFAGQFLMGLAAGQQRKMTTLHARDISADCYKIADAMLAEREKGNQ